MTEVKTRSDGPEINAADGNANDRELPGPDLKGDWTNVFILLLLYIMQGLPLGISSAIPLLMQNKPGVTYGDQAKFSLTEYPFTLKILWAPLVDALYVKRFGRRKTWLVPTQYLIGIILIYVASEIDNLLPDNGKPDVISLVCVFFSTSFLAATQDIAVDGWSLTMLKKNNVGYSAICNSMGQILGMLLGSMPIILLTSENYCNKYLRTTPVLGGGGVVTMQTLFYGWAIMFIAVTTLIAIFKREKDCKSEDDHVKVNVLQSYSRLWYILKLPSIRILAIILITVKIGVTPSNFDIVNLKLIDAGISKDSITFIQSTLNGINVLLPIAMAKFVSGPKSMNIFLKSTIYRLPMNVANGLIIYYTSKILLVNNIVPIPAYYYALLVVTFLMQSVLSYSTFIALQSFFSQISDARFGGTYMTLLNTLHNFGNRWTVTTAFASLDLLTINKYSNVDDCSADLPEMCNRSQGKSTILVDGYYVEVLLCTIIGIIWYFVFRKKVKSLQTKRPVHWLVEMKNTRISNTINA